MESKIKNFKDLQIWQTGMGVVKSTYILCKKLPTEELYGLSAQMKRAAVSIPSNIAEGFKRYHNKEYKQFLYITLGSAAELETQLLIAVDLGHVSSQDVASLLEELDHLGRMITMLLRKL